MNKTISKLFMENKYSIYLILVIFLPFLVLLAFGKVIFWGTASLQFVPWNQFLFDSVLNGNFPLWNPYNGLGVPFIANHQSAVFYPLNWILFLFYWIGNISGLVIGMTLLIPVHLAIAGIGMMRLLNEFGRSKFSQFSTAIVFVFSGYILTRLSFISMVWTFAWFPWIIYACIHLKPLKNWNSLRSALLLSIYIAIQLLAGHAQTSYYTLLVGGVIVLFYNYKNITYQIQKSFTLIVSIFFSLLISAIQIIPTFEYLQNSQRSSEVGYDLAVSASLWPGRLLTMFFGNFWGNPNYSRFLSGGNFWEENIYIGVFTLLFSSILFWILTRKNRRNQLSAQHKGMIYLASGTIIFSLLFSFGRFFPLFPFLYNHIPTFDLFQAPSRFILIYVFMVCLLFSFGIDLWFISKFNYKKTIIYLVIFGGLLLISFFIKLFLPEMPEITINSILLGSFLGFCFGLITLIKDKTHLDTKWFQLLIIGFILFDLLFHNFLWENFQSIETYKTVNNDLPKNEFDRVYLNENAENFLKFNLFFRPDRLHPLANYQNITPSYIPNLNLLNNRFSMVNNFDPLQPEKYSEFSNWVSNLEFNELKTVISLVSGNRIIDIDPTQTSFFISHDIQSMNLIQWYGCAKKSQSKDVLSEILYLEKNYPDNRCVLISDLDETNSYSQQDNDKSLELNYNFLNPNTINIEYYSDQPGWIVIRQNWYPGWKAVIDNSYEIDVKNVDYLFQGLEVPSGKHTIELKFTPISFKTGLIISLMSLLLVSIFFIYYSNYRKTK